ncbi:helix-turn-helix domain-containing protein [Nocardia pseudovaccinii]|uniref:helix-turn-helix domain-containing protein n=1 Tax=Nocardia pseudovaccinii TaxID=189540 RepID=UPI000A044CB8|nr:helix-turn-helix transcriptional regulator [Nocardia pseudovaccinii]
MAVTANRVDGAKLIPEWDFADRIRKVRTIAGMDQKAFAEALDVTAGSYAGWEAGRSKPRDPVSIAKRMELLTSVPATWVLGLHEETPRPNDPNEGPSDVVRPKGFEPLTF